MKFRNRRSKEVRTVPDGSDEAAGLAADPRWADITAGADAAEPAEPAEPAEVDGADLSCLDKDGLLAFAADHNLEVNPRLGPERLAEEITAALTAQTTD